MERGQAVEAERKESENRDRAQKVCFDGCLSHDPAQRNIMSILSVRPGGLLNSDFAS